MQTDDDLIVKASRLGISLNGVYTKDTLPAIKQGGYIINLQDDYDSSGVNLHGTHWTAVYVEKQGSKYEVSYFDSFGLPPPSDVQIWLYEYQPYPYSNIQIQNEQSGFCGDYCLYYLWFMEHNKKKRSLSDRMYQFQDLWSNDVEDNLRLLKRYLKNL
jgi:hypothetical protein